MRRRFLLAILPLVFAGVGSEPVFAQRQRALTTVTPQPSLQPNCIASCSGQASVCQTTCGRLTTSSSSSLSSSASSLSASTCLQTCSLQLQTCQTICAGAP